MTDIQACIYGETAKQENAWRPRTAVSITENMNPIFKYILSNIAKQIFAQFNKLFFLVTYKNQEIFGLAIFFVNNAVQTITSISTVNFIIQNVTIRTTWI